MKAKPKCPIVAKYRFFEVFKEIEKCHSLTFSLSGSWLAISIVAFAGKNKLF